MLLSKRAITKMQAVIIAVIIIVAAIIGTIAYMYKPTPTPTPTQAPIKIGLIGELTGVEAFLGIGGFRGARLAVDEINGAGGINGRKIELIVYDDGGSPEGAVTMARKLVYEDKVCAALLSHGSELALPAGKIFDEAKVPALLVFAGHPDITKGGWCFRAGLTAVGIGKAFAYFDYTVLGARTMAQIVTVDPWEEKVADVMKATFEKLGGQVIYRKSVEWGEKEYTSILTEVKALNPDVIHGPNDFSMTIPFATQARGLGITCPLTFPDSSCCEEFLAGVKDIAEVGGGIYVDSYVRIDTPTAKEFYDKYKKRWAEPPVPTSSYTAYDCIKLLAKIIAEVGDDPVKIHDALSNIKDFEGVSGTIKEYINNECIKYIPIYTIKKGEFVLAKLITEPEYISPF